MRHYRVVNTGPLPPPSEELEAVQQARASTLIDRTLAEGPSLGGPAPPSRLVGALTPGLNIGHYVVLERIGAGAMGVVYAAFDPRLDRKVALKLLRPAGHRIDIDRAKQRLLREAQALAKLKHPNVVTVHDVGAYADQIFVAMEYVDGPTLATWLESSPTVATVLDVYLQAGTGLQAAHAAGLVHRDFKPDNVMLGEGGRPRVMDFGLARSPQELAQEHLDSRGEPSASPPPQADALATPLTQTGALLGTPAYMSPEQHMGLPADAKSDQFAFCVALYEALYGQRPFTGRTVAQLGIAVTTGEFNELPKELRERRVPTWLRNVVLRGLQTAPVNRYADMAALLAALRDDPSRRRQRWLGVGVGVALMGLVSLGVYKVATKDQQACLGGKAQIERSWNASTKRDLVRAFDSTGRAWAQTSATQLTSELDRFAGSWANIHAEACMATRVRGERSEVMLDRQMICLDRAQREIDALLSQWLAADTDTVDAASLASTELPSISACADLEGLERGVAPPRPEIIARVDAARDGLAKARAARLTGHVESARSHLDAAAQLAETIDYPPYTAEHALEAGAIARFAGDFKVASEAFERAYGLAIEHRADAVAARAAAELVYVQGYRLAKPELGYAWALQARHWTARIDPEGPLQALALHNLGVLHDANGSTESAAVVYREALRIRVKSFGETHPLVGRSNHNIGNVYLDTGEYAKARAQYQKAIDIYALTYGDAHPVMAGSLNNLGVAYRRDRMFKLAIDALQRAVKIYEGVFGKSHPDVALSLDNLGITQVQAGLYEAAEANIRRGMEIRRKVFGPTHPDFADSLCSLARLELARARPKAALEAARNALPLYKKAFGETHFQIAATQALVGLALVDAGQPKAALAPLHEAEALRRSQSSAPWERAEVSGALSLALLRTGQPEAAEQARTRALADYALAGSAFDAAVNKLGVEFAAAGASQTAN